MLILGFILWAWPLIFIIVYILINRLITPLKSVCVLVLGDIGRSPRMQYHSLSFAKEGYQVDIVGYRGLLLEHKIMKFLLTSGILEYFHCQFTGLGIYTYS